MAFQTYDGDTTIITDLATYAADRPLTGPQTQEKFDEGLTNYVAWFNTVHKAALDAAARTAPGYAADAGASDAYAITVSPAITAYSAGQMFTFYANTANTGACTLNVCAVGALAIKKLTSSGLADTDTGDIPAGAPVAVIHNGTYFVGLGLGIGSHAANTGNPHATTLPQVGGSNKNLLHNWDFLNPVNQRGAASYSSAGYTIDRWVIPGAYGNFTSITPGANGITFISPGTRYWGQLIEGIRLAGKTCTVSLKINGVVHSVVSAFPASLGDAPYVQVGTSDIYVSLQNPATTYMGLYLKFATATYSNIEAIKLELGSVSTLANDSPADFGEQLALCQRFYQVIGKGTTYGSYLAKIVSGAYGFYDGGIVQFLTKMRINPTVNIYSSTNTVGYVRDVTANADISVQAVTYVNETCFRVVLNASGVVGHEVWFYITASADL